MGYTTDFEGRLDIHPALTMEQGDYINLLCSTRRMKRDIKVLWEMYKGKHGNPFAIEKTPIGIYGHEGEFFAKDGDEDGVFAEKAGKSVIDINTPPGQMLSQGMENFNKVRNVNEARMKGLTCQPGLWCQWKITDDGEMLVWDGGEKFYNYIEWLRYLIDRFFSKWGVLLNGEITWQGEETDDKGKIVVKNNEVKVLHGRVVYDDGE